MKSASFVLPAVAVTALTTLATAQTPRMGGPMRHVMVSFASHDVGGKHHVEGARRHTELMEAIFALDRLLAKTPQP